MQDEIFEKILKFVLEKEGGYVNDPTDLGGETNKGITYRTYNSYRKSLGLPAQSVKHISDDEVKDIYYNNYYKASGADKIEDPKMAAYVFDTAVNMGVSRAQTFLNQSGGDINKFEKLRRDKYNEFVKANPSQKKYIQGWNNRVNSVVKFVHEGLPPERPSIDEGPTTTLQGYVETTPMEQLYKETFGMSYPTGYATPIQSNIPKAYTPQQIGAMSTDEFKQNESVIMEQLKQGLIQSQQEPSKNLGEFVNPETGSSKIYSREDIAAMSTKEYEAAEKEINAQMNSIGVPTKAELEKSVKAGDTVFVNSYSRADGTEVKGYYRARPR